MIMIYLAESTLPIVTCMDTDMLTELSVIKFINFQACFLEVKMQIFFVCQQLNWFDINGNCIDENLCSGLKIYQYSILKKNWEQQIQNACILLYVKRGLKFGTVFLFPYNEFQLNIKSGGGIYQVSGFMLPVCLYTSSERKYITYVIFHASTPQI